MRDRRGLNRILVLRRAIQAASLDEPFVEVGPSCGDIDDQAGLVIDSELLGMGADFGDCTDERGENARQVVSNA